MCVFYNLMLFFRLLPMNQPTILGITIKILNVYCRNFCYQTLHVILTVCVIFYGVPCIVPVQSKAIAYFFLFFPEKQSNINNRLLKVRGKLGNSTHPKYVIKLVFSFLIKHFWSFVSLKHMLQKILYVWCVLPLFAF
jgi:hypothetical protein